MKRDATPRAVETPLRAGEPLLTLEEVASVLQVTEQTVRKLTLSQGLRFIRVGRQLRFKRQWIDAFVEGRR